MQWLGVGLVGLTALVLAAAHAPGRIRLLGLFAIVFGGVCGWGLARIAGALRVNAGRLVGLAIVGVLVAAAETGLTLESWRLHVAERRREYFEESVKTIPGPLRESALEELRPIFEREARFPSYLQYRVKNLGDWESPWPVLFWTGELLLGTAAGIGAFAALGSGQKLNRH
jgi:hypothetical protein